MGYINERRIANISLNSVKIFKIIYNTTIYAPIVARWLSNLNIQVQGESDIAEDFVSELNANLIYDVLVTSHIVGDIEFTYGFQSSINATIETFEVKDLDINYILAFVINGILESAIAKDLGSLSIRFELDYAINDLTSHEAVDFITETLKGRVDLIETVDVIEAIKDFSLSIGANFNLIGDLDTGLAVEVDEINYNSSFNYGEIIEICNTTEISEIISTFNSTFNIDLEDLEAEDLALLMSANSVINTSIEVLRDATLSDYANNTLEELASETLENLILFEI